MKLLIERLRKKLVIFLLVLPIFLVNSCAPMGFGVMVDTNLPLETTRVTVLNTTPSYFYILIDGAQKGIVEPYGKWNIGLWVGTYYGTEMAIQIIDKKGFAYADNVWLSSFNYPRSYTFTIRKETGGRLWVERR